MEEVINFIKDIGIGIRHPHDDFLTEGNNDCQPLKPFGICDFDEEEFYHKPYYPFSCHIPGCDSTFETVMQYESHYNSCHSFTCKECKKNLPNYHLLDLHISETHDSFFMEQAKRKPMFQCFVQECKELFKKPQERHSHCITVHKFPSDFRFDAFRKMRNKKKDKVTKQEVNNDNKTDEGTHEELMDISENQTRKASNKKVKPVKNFTFGHSKGRRPVLHNFTKDLFNSLPE